MSRSVMRRCGAVVLLLAVLLPATSASAIYDGTPITSAPGWAAYVTTVNKFLLTQTQESSCTGTVVGDRWVLTAAHCVVTETKTGASTSTPRPAKDFRVVLGRSDLSKTTQGGQWTVSSVQVYPGWDPGSLQGDVALMHLVGALPAAAIPLPLGPSKLALSDGQAVAAYGYGNVTETYPKKGGYKGTGSTSLRVTKPGSYQQQADCTKDLIWCMHHVGSSQILHGDSGGPWVVDTDNPYVIGVTSFNTAFSSTGSDTGTYAYHGTARVTAADVRSWVSTTAGLVTGVADRIYRNADTGNAGLMREDGFLAPIPDGGTYECLVGRGHPVVNLGAFNYAELPQTTSNAGCSSGTVLLYGDGDAGEDPSGFANLENALSSAGLNVATLPGQTTLPSDLSPYGQIWHYGIDVPSAADQQALINFVKAGGGLFLTGERPCCEGENAADSAIVNSLVTTVGGIGVGGLGDIGSCGDNEPINQGVEDGVATNPNALTTWHPVCPGGLSNVAPQNVFASSPGGVPVGAVWDDTETTGGGRLAILMDVNWPQTQYRDPVTMPLVAQNLGTFLAGR